MGQDPRTAQLPSVARPSRIVGRRIAPEVPGVERLITKRQLAGHLQMTTRWIEMQQRLGLPVLRLGAANRYKLSEVEAWLRERYHSENTPRGA